MVRWWAVVMQKANMVIAVLSAIIGGFALDISLASGQPFALGTVLGVVLLFNAYVRYRLARRE